MSSNIYENPDLTVNVRYGNSVRQDGRDREERLVDIYESVDALTDCRVDLPTQDGGVHTEKHRLTIQRNLFRAAALILGLLLVVGATVLSRLYLSAIFEKHELSMSYKELQTSYDNLSNSYCKLQGEENRTQGNITRWKRFRYSCYYKSTEKKSWEDSKKDCQSRGADLVVINNREEQDFLRELNEPGDSWIGLESSMKKKGWEGDSVEWKWVDRSTSTYMGWKVGVRMQPEHGSRGYIDVDGTLNHSIKGSKQWICEKQMH